MTGTRRTGTLTPFGPPFSLVAPPCPLVLDKRVFAEEFGWVGFLAVCFLYKINPNLTKNCLLHSKKKVAQNVTF